MQRLYLWRFGKELAGNTFCDSLSSISSCGRLTNKTVREKDKLRAVVWTLGLWAGLVFCLLRLVGVIRILGYQKRRFVPPEGGLIVIYRHPSLQEPAFLPFLFFPWFLSNSRLVPFSTPAKDYYSKWWFWILRPVCIPIDGGNERVI